MSIKRRFNIGDRVVAVVDVDPDTKTVRLFGAGTYMGEEVPSADAAGLAPIARSLQRENPKILLDSGDIVWGAECWWGHEASFAQRYPVTEWKWEYVSIKEMREGQKLARNGPQS